MQKYDWYFRQKVSATEMQNAFDGAEAAVDRAYVDAGIVGVTSGGVVSQHSPTANLSVDVTAGVVVDQAGQRAAWGSLQNVDCSVDENGASTAVVGAGNEKYLAVFAEFVRAPGSARIDGEGATVYYDQAESFQLNVAQGAEATAGAAVKVALRGDQILLADILIAFGTTQILNAAVTTTRREYAVVATSAAVTIRRNTAEEAMQDVADALVDNLTALQEATKLISRMRALSWRKTDVIFSGLIARDIDWMPSDTADMFMAIGDNNGVADSAVVAYSYTGSEDWQAGQVLAGTVDQGVLIFRDTDNDLWVICGLSAAGGVQVQTTATHSSAWVAATPTGLTTGGDVPQAIIRSKHSTTRRTILFGYDDSASKAAAIYTASATYSGAWTAASLPATAREIYSADVNPTTNVMCGIGMNTSSDGIIIRSTDNGSTWANVTPTLSPVVQDGAQVVYDAINGCWWAATETRLLKSTDDGATWTVTAVTARTLVGVGVGENGELLVNTLSGVGVSCDVGVTWYFSGNAKSTYYSSSGHLKKIRGRFYLQGFGETLYISLNVGEAATF